MSDRRFLLTSDRRDQALPRLLRRHYVPPEDSVAALADLHWFVNEHRDETITLGDEKLPAHPDLVAYLDGRVDQARRRNDAGWLRKYAKAVELARAGATHKLDLTARSLMAWGKRRMSLGRPPIRKEVAEWVEKETGVKSLRGSGGVFLRIWLNCSSRPGRGKPSVASACKGRTFVHMAICPLTRGKELCHGSLPNESTLAYTSTSSGGGRLRIRQPSRRRTGLRPA
jgi:hypothetical protein